jgi:hypothetical protein
MATWEEVEPHLLTLAKAISESEGEYKELEEFITYVRKVEGLTDDEKISYYLTALQSVIISGYFTYESPFENAW